MRWGPNVDIFAIISQKGGAGKTTLAVNLAVAAELEDVPTVIIDFDPQASAKTWHDLRGKDAPVVMSAQAEPLAGNDRDRPKQWRRARHRRYGTTFRIVERWPRRGPQT